MPTYEYQCQGCGTKKDVRLSIRSNPRVMLRCEKCDAKSMVRLISGGAGFCGEKPFQAFEATTVAAKPEYLRRSDGSLVMHSNGRPVIRKLHFPIVTSKQQMREIAAGSWNGEKHEINAL